MFAESSAWYITHSNVRCMPPGWSRSRRRWIQTRWLGLRIVFFLRHAAWSRDFFVNRLVVCPRQTITRGTNLWRVTLPIIVHPNVIVFAKRVISIDIQKLFWECVYLVMYNVANTRILFQEDDTEKGNIVGVVSDEETLEIIRAGQSRVRLFIRLH